MRRLISLHFNTVFSILYGSVHHLVLECEVLYTFQENYRPKEVTSFENCVRLRANVKEALNYAASHCEASIMIRTGPDLSHTFQVGLEPSFKYIILPLFHLISVHYARQPSMAYEIFCKTATVLVCLSRQFLEQVNFRAKLFNDK